ATRAAAAIHPRYAPDPGRDARRATARARDRRRPPLGGPVDPGTARAPDRSGTDRAYFHGAHVSPYLAAPLGLPHASHTHRPQSFSPAASRDDGRADAAGAAPAHGGTGADCGEDRWYPSVCRRGDQSGAGGRALHRRPGAGRGDRAAAGIGHSHHTARGVASSARSAGERQRGGTTGSYPRAPVSLCLAAGCRTTGGRAVTAGSGHVSRGRVAVSTRAAPAGRLYVQACPHPGGCLRIRAAARAAADPPAPRPGAGDTVFRDGDDSAGTTRPPCAAGRVVG